VQLIKKKRCIAFVGDSFCAALSKYHYDRYGRNHLQSPVNDPACAAFPSLVADHYDLNLLAHGYSGKSWWFSRSEFLKQLDRNPKIKDKIDAIVFCHTDRHRINSDSIYASSVNHGTTPREDTSYANKEDQLTGQAQVQWIKHLYDGKFQLWSQLNWFREISREWAHVKQVHFHCFSQLEEQHNHLLVGQRFTTPLINVSVSELTGTAREIRNQLMTDRRANHLNDDNNRTLAKITIDALDNYEHKTRPIDMSMFKNIVNPNYDKFPLGNFGSN
jgi:hypothetical protein